MSRNRSYEPINQKNRTYCYVESQKMYAQQMKRECGYGIPKGRVDVNVGHISSIYPITRMQLFLLAGIAVGTVATGGIDCESLTGIVDGHATPQVSNDRMNHNCDAGLPLPDFTPSDDGADASANQALFKTGAVMGDFISQRIGQRIGGAKNG